MAAMVVGGQIVVKQLLAQFTPQPAAPRPVVQSIPTASVDVSGLPLQVTPHWPAGTPLTLEIYTSTDPSPPVVAPPQAESPLVTFTNLTYGAWADQSRFADVYVEIPDSVRLRNASIFADMFLRARGGEDAVHVRKPLVKYMPPRKIRKEVSLLGGNSSAVQTQQQQDDDDAPPHIIPHFSPNLTLVLVPDSATIKYRAQPPPIRSHINLSPLGTTYYPILYPNEFWHLQDSLIPLNGSTTTPTRLPLRITYDPQAMWKFNLYAHMNMAFEQQAAAKASGAAAATGPMGGASGAADLDELKKMLISANPYWLGITIVVTLLHTLYVPPESRARGKEVERLTLPPRGQLRVPRVLVRRLALAEKG